MEEKKENKLIRGVNVLVTILLILAIALCAYIVFQLVNDGNASIGGYRMFRVVTGSMEPTMSVGTLLVTKTVDISTIDVGDIVCFRSYDEQIYGSVITHRVVGILHDTAGTLLQTKGDANPVADGDYASQENLVGKVIWYAGEKNVLTSVFSFFTNKVGFLGCIVFPCLLIAGLILQNCVKNIRIEMQKAQETSATEQTDPINTMTQHEYEEMIARIRVELTEELLQRNSVSEGEHHVGISEEEQTDTSK